MENWVVLRTRGVTGSDAQMMTDVGQGTSIEIVAETVPTAAVADLAADPTTIAAAPDMPVALIEPFGGTGAATGDAWGVSAVGADSSPFTGAGVTVAVLDTGIEAGHPAFAGMMLEEEDFTGSGNGDRKGHGTHCAGTIFGRDVSGRRIGVARGVNRALIGKVLDDAGRGSAMTALRGMQWAAGRGAQVISMSLGFDTAGMISKLRQDGWPRELAAAQGLDAYRRNLRLFDRALHLFGAFGGFGAEPLIVAATGNASRRSSDPRFRIPADMPAAADQVLSVGALGRAPEGLQVAFFSNSMPALSAPGVDVESAALGGGLRTLNGTSMACPHVAGLAALWWHALGETASAASVREALLVGASRAELAPGYDHTDVGRGLARAP